MKKPSKNLGPISIDQPIKVHQCFDQYELLDSGAGQKLERFNQVVLIRPEVSALGPSGLAAEAWQKLAWAKFIPSSDTAGHWQIYQTLPADWHIKFRQLKLKLQLTKFKHIGLFPEQALNWSWLEAQVACLPPSAKLLNLFGYTGAASLAAAALGFEVTHVDAIKQVLNWGKANMRNSKLDGIKWLIDDAPKFVKREVRRAHQYDAIILDPPTKGRGPKGELWNINHDLEELLNNILKILKPKCFVILNLYSSNITKPYLHKLILNHFKEFKIEFCDEVIGQAQTKTTISHGYFVRLSRS